jgi:hypothetical protein
VGDGATKESRMVKHILGTRAAVIGGWNRLAVNCCCRMEAVWSGGGGASVVVAAVAVVAAVDPAGWQQEGRGGRRWREWGGRAVA